MSYGPNAVYVQTIASGGSITGSYDLRRVWPYVYLVVPTMSVISTTTCNIYIWGSADNVQPYFQFALPPQNTATTGFNTFTLANSISQCIVPIPNACRYIKVQVGNTATAGVSFQVICSSN